MKNLKNLVFNLSFVLVNLHFIHIEAEPFWLFFSALIFHFLLSIFYFFKEA